MDIVYEDIIEKEIAKIYKVRGKQIIIFGCGARNAYLYRRLKKEAVDVRAFIKEDMGREKGETYQGIRIINRKELKKIENPLILVFEDMKASADELAAERSDIEIAVLPPELPQESMNRRQKTEYLIKKIRLYQSGYNIYKALKKKYNAKKILVFSGQSGDLFNALVYLEEYVRAAGIGDKFLLTVIGGPCRQVAEMFNVKYVEKLNMLDTKKLILLYELCGKNVNIVPVHASEAHIKNTVITKMNRRNGITLGKMYKYQSFLLNELSKPKLPEYVRDSDYVGELFEKKGYPLKRTVLISPYANSYMDDKLMAEWKHLCKWLVKAGYHVLTNCGAENELPVEGTEGIFIPLKYVVDFIEQGGWFVGIRSGLCDIVSGARCMKIILYKEDLYTRGDYLTFHSLKRMGLCDDAAELSYSRENQEKMFEAVKRYF